MDKVEDVLVVKSHLSNLELNMSNILIECMEKIIIREPQVHVYFLSGLGPAWIWKRPQLPSHQRYL